MKKRHKSSPALEIIFPRSNLEGIIPRNDDPMIISVVMANTKVKKVFMDHESSVDIRFKDAFDKLGLTNSDL